MGAAEETIWTIKRCLEWTTTFLGERGQEHPRLSAEWLLSAATGLERIALYMNYDRPLSPDELCVMHDGIVRRGRGEPLQYITGETAFRALSIACEPGVLIPRPETELLVDVVLEYLDGQVIGAREAQRERTALPWNAEVEAARAAEQADMAAQPRANEPQDRVEAGVSDSVPATTDLAPVPARVLEVGCGTGCISLALASERPGRIACVAIDIDQQAILLAKRNRERCGLARDAVDIRRGDMVSPVRDEECNTFDVLVSNPPYIPSSVMDTLPREVADFEPHLALDGGPDGLDIFRRLVAEAPRMLKPGGLLACELFEESLDAAADICRVAGMANIEIRNDLTGRPRFIFAHTPECADEETDGMMRASSGRSPMRSV